MIHNAIYIYFLTGVDICIDLSNQAIVCIIHRVVPKRNCLYDPQMRVVAGERNAAFTVSFFSGTVLLSMHILFVLFVKITALGKPISMISNFMLLELLSITGLQSLQWPGVNRAVS